MKRSTILLSSLLALTAASGHSQTTGGGTQGATGANQNTTGQNTSGTTQNAAGVGVNQNAPGATPPPGLERRGQLPPGLPNRSQLPPGLATRTNGFAFATNRFGKNGFGSSTNFFGTNGFLAGTNQFGSGPTSRTGGLSRVFATKQVIRRDVAFTAADKQLLTRIRQTVSTQITRVGTLSTVRYVVRDGLVRIVGFVRTTEESQRIATIVQSIPGVLRVENQLQTGADINAATGLSMANALATNQFGVSAILSNQFGTNLSPTSRPQAPSRIFGTNPPPGLQRRLDLPAGSQSQTNSPPPTTP
jgi:hypothetical protein